MTDLIQTFTPILCLTIGIISLSIVLSLLNKSLNFIQSIIGKK